MKRHQFTIVILGNCSVGKSSIIRQRISNSFIETYCPSFEDYYQIMVDVDRQHIKLNIIEIVGSEEYKSLRSYQIHKANGFIIVYSITSRSSFEDIQKIYQQIHIEKELNYNEFIPICIAGNKIDLFEKRKITTHEGQNLADKLNVKFIECSAKKSINITDLFQNISLEILENDSLKQKISTKQSNSKQNHCTLT
ncbi:Sphingomyelin phosphodiesterase [Entamoeba marina]